EQIHESTTRLCRLFRDLRSRAHQACLSPQFRLYVRLGRPWWEFKQGAGGQSARPSNLHNADESIGSVVVGVGQKGGSEELDTGMAARRQESAEDLDAIPNAKDINRIGYVADFVEVRHTYSDEFARRVETYASDIPTA